MSSQRPKKRDKRRTTILSGGAVSSVSVAVVFVRRLGVFACVIVIQLFRGAVTCRDLSVFAAGVVGDTCD